VPRFSVVIPLYNKEKDIKNTLSSVLAQSLDDFEIIIVNDGSTDSSEEIVNEFIDKRIHLFSEKNKGVSSARNFGVEKASSDYIAFLDADDYWYPNHLENLFSLITKFPNHLWYATAYEKKRNENLIIPMVSPVMDKGENWMGEIDDFFKNCYIDSLTNSSSVCFMKRFIISLEGFNATFSHGEDTDLWIRTALKSPLAFSNKITVRTNLDSHNKSSNIPTHKRKSININNFEEEEKSNSSLKKFLDLNRYSLALQHKISGDLKSFEQFKNKIDINNLNKKQYFLLNQNRNILRLMNNLQNILEKLGIRLSSF
jgi:glycosyltransferase involved in cell wall biosynthesis